MTWRRLLCLVGLHVDGGAIAGTHGLVHRCARCGRLYEWVALSTLEQKRRAWTQTRRKR
jgi:hypothetical protein